MYIYTYKDNTWYTTEYRHNEHICKSNRDSQNPNRIQSRRIRKVAETIFTAGHILVMLPPSFVIPQEPPNAHITKIRKCVTTCMKYIPGLGCTYVLFLFFFGRTPKSGFGTKLTVKNATDANTQANSASRRSESNGQRPGPGFGQNPRKKSQNFILPTRAILGCSGHLKLGNPCFVLVYTKQPSCFGLRPPGARKSETKTVFVN